MRGLVWLLLLMPTAISLAQGGGGAAASRSSDQLSLPVIPPPPVADQSIRGTIQGTVKSKDSAQGISSAIVHLFGPSPVAGAPAIKLTVTSNPDGSFSFLDLPGGRYALDAEREGYFPPQMDSGMTVVITANSKDAKVTLSLIAGGIISGRLHDAQDRPISGVSISPMIAAYWNGRKVFANNQGWGTQTTNDRGEYRLFWLPPGEYAVRTNSGIGSPGYRPADGPNVPQLTFYPGVTDQSRAVPLIVHAGEEVKGIDFAVEYAPAFSVSGTVRIQVPGGALQNGLTTRTVFLSIARENATPLETSQLTNPIRSADLNRFEFPFEARGIPPGRYSLLASFQSGQTMYRALTPIQVIDENVTDISINIRQFPDLEFRVKQQDITGSTPPALNRMRVELRARGPLGSFFIVEESLKPDGSIVFPSMNPGEYAISLADIPSGFYLSDIQHAAVSLMRDGILRVDGNEATAVGIVLGVGGGSVRGTVRNNRGQPAASLVVLIPQQSHRSNATLYKYAIASPDGAFSFADIPPGEYKLFAWQDLIDGAEKSPEFLARYEVYGRTISIGTRSRLDDIALEVMPRD